METLIELGNLQGGPAPYVVVLWKNDDIVLDKSFGAYHVAQAFADAARNKGFTPELFKAYA